MEWNKNGLLPLEWFRQMRTKSPVTTMDGNGAWNVFKYEDVKAVFTNYEVFSSQGALLPMIPLNPVFFGRILRSTVSCVNWYPMLLRLA